MKRLLFYTTFIFYAACSPKNEEVENTNISQEAPFDNFKQNFILSLWKMYPGWASSAGYHRYDSLLTVPDSARRVEELRFTKLYLDSIKKYNASDLSSSNRIDLYLIRDFLNGNVFGLQKLKAFEWDPSGYNVCGSFAEMLSNNYDSLDNRLLNFDARMLNVDAYYEAAKKNIKNPTIEHTELAIGQNEGGASVFEIDLEEALKKCRLSNEKKEEIKARGTQCAKTVRGFANWLKKLENKQPRSFRLGKELYHEKFQHDIQSGYTAEEIYAIALSHKNTLHKNV